MSFHLYFYMFTFKMSIYIIGFVPSMFVFVPLFYSLHVFCFSSYLFFFTFSGFNWAFLYDSILPSLPLFFLLLYFFSLYRNRKVCGRNIHSFSFNFPEEIFIYDFLWKIIWIICWWSSIPLQYFKYNNPLSPCLYDSSEIYCKCYLCSIMSKMSLLWIKFCPS